MRTLIIYESTHHGNTFKLVDAIEEEFGCDLRDMADDNVDHEHIDFDEYDLVGIASGVAYGKLYKGIEEFVASDKSPCNKRVFILYTCGNRNLKSIHYLDHIREILKEKDCTLEGEYGCAGYDTFGPLKTHWWYIQRTS